MPINCQKSPAWPPVNQTVRGRPAAEADLPVAADRIRAARQCQHAARTGREPTVILFAWTVPLEMVI